MFASNKHKKVEQFSIKCVSKSDKVKNEVEQIFKASINPEKS